MDRMSPLDATFLHIEDGVNHMHIASCALFEGPAPAYADVVALFAGLFVLVWTGMRADRRAALARG